MTCATVLAAFVGAALAQTQPHSTPLFPLRDIRPGLRGVGRTVFHGNQIEEFQVEILGVLEGSGPQQSIILARLTGGPLADTGVIQGMSGSPVYIDGKLIGAVALGFPFAKEAIAGIQPIEQMLADASLSASRRSGPPGTGLRDLYPGAGANPLLTKASSPGGTAIAESPFG